MSIERAWFSSTLFTQLLHPPLTILLCITLCLVPASAQMQPTQLPHAPDPHLSSSSDSGSGVIRPGPEKRVPLQECPYDQTHARECRVHWPQLLISTTTFLAFLNAGNLYTGYWYRYETTHGNWFQRWIDSAADWQWNRWSDSNPVLDDYVGHPMMGAITDDLWIQNDPKSMTVVQSNTWPYWRGILRATAFTTIVHFEWKLGPIGEAGFGHNGDHPQYTAQGVTYGTGDVEIVTTPIVGGLWKMAEDSIDKHFVAHLEDHPRNPFMLFGLSFLTPAQGAANVLRFRPPWFRDTRIVKAASFWSDPPPPYDRQTTEMAEYEASAASAADRLNKSENELAAESSSSAAAVRLIRPVPQEPQWPRPGGVHEFGAWWGLSLMSGHIWGYAKDIKYMPIDVRYSYLFSLHDHWAMRYSPEVTALAMLDEPIPDPTNNPQTERKRTYGSGVSPVGFQSDFFPSHRVQPFLSTNGGFIYFLDHVLSPQGSQFMYTVDFGCGVNIFRKARQAVSIGYRYQHLSNANISEHNPGTDANTFYVSVSRFRTKGYR